MRPLSSVFRPARWLFVGSLLASACSPAPPAVVSPPLDPPRSAEPAPAPSGRSIEDRVQAIEAAFEAARKKHDVPGAALAVVHHGRVILLRGFGARDLARGLPVTPDTRLPIGSATKSFTAALAAIAAEEGRLALDAHPRRYLPAFSLKDPDANARVTLRDLLCHRTGLERTGDLVAPFLALDRRELIALLGLAEPSAPLGTKFFYNNIAYGAAGEAIAAAYGVPYEELVRQKILGPLGMTSSGFGRPAQMASPEPALGYPKSVAGSPGPRAPIVDTDDLLRDAPAGGMFSTARDMAQWLLLLTGHGAVGERRLLQPASLEALWTKQIDTGWKGNPGYGLGFFLRQWRGLRLVEHGGNVAGFETAVALLPGEDLGLAMLTNISGSPLRSEVQEIVFSNLLDVEAPPAPPVPPPAAAPTETAPPAFQAPMPAEALLEKVVTAMGGKARLAALRSSRKRIHVRYLGQGVEGERVLDTKAPDHFHQVETFTAFGKQLGTTELWGDGAESWVGSAPLGQAISARPLSPSVTASNRRDLDLAPALHWKELWKRVAIVGTAEVAGEPCHVLRRTPAEGDPVEDLVSAKRFLVLVHKDGDTTERYSDFRRVGGVLIPFRSDIEDPGGMNRVEQVISVELDGKTEGWRFRPPSMPR